MKRVLASMVVTAMLVSTTRADAADSAAAEALFLEAKQLLAAGKLVEACKKLEDSNRVEPAIGTRYQLAQCHERTGKHASAWAGYVEVANEAKSRGQLAREKVARVRAAALEGKLVRMTIEIRNERIEGLVVRRNGVALDRAQWGAAIPIDPGGYEIEASAPGRKTWKTFVEVTVDRAANLISVPDLEAAPRGSPRLATAMDSAAADANAGAIAAAPPPPSGPTWMKPVGIVLAAAGTATLATGLFFGSRAMSKNDEAATHCRGVTCDSVGVDLRAQAVSAGDAATIALIAGGSALAVGSLLWMLSPSRPDPPEPRARSFDVGVGPRGVDVRGAW
jgi:hypothetical protein